MKRAVCLESLVILVAVGGLLLGCGGGSSGASPDAVVDGRRLFRGSCSMCHGPNGEGMPGLGQKLDSNPFVAGLTDEELVGFLQVGRSADDPLNELGVPMPPRGGNPALSDQDLALIVAYVRSLQ